MMIALDSIKPLPFLRSTRLCPVAQSRVHRKLKMVSVVSLQFKHRTGPMRIDGVDKSNQKLRTLGLFDLK